MKVLRFVGSIFVLLGVLLIPLPGPGLALIMVGVIVIVGCIVAMRLNPAIDSNGH